VGGDAVIVLGVLVRERRIAKFGEHLATCDECDAAVWVKVEHHEETPLCRRCLASAVWRGGLAHLWFTEEARPWAVEQGFELTELGEVPEIVQAIAWTTNPN
jgi:hypothetical protein